MAKIIGLPKLSPTMEEGTLVAWTKKEGDEVDVDDLLAEVETDKATMEFRSFDRGVLLKILVPEGETLEPDAPVAIIGKAGEDIGDLLAQVEAESVPASVPASVPVSVPVPAAVPASVPAPVSELVSVSGDGGGVLSSPAGSSFGSRTQHRSPHRAGVGTAWSCRQARYRIVCRWPRLLLEASALRRACRESEQHAADDCATAHRVDANDVPHYYLTIDVDITPLVGARKAMNAELEACRQEGFAQRSDHQSGSCGPSPGSRGQRLMDGQRDPLPPGCRYLDRCSHRRGADDTGEFETPIAKASRRLPTKVRDLAARARDKKLQLEEMTNGTFSISVTLGCLGSRSSPR